jgi:hypothetical protein
MPNGSSHNSGMSRAADLPSIGSCGIIHRANVLHSLAIDMRLDLFREITPVMLRLEHSRQ